MTNDEIEIEIKYLKKQHEKDARSFAFKVLFFYLAIGSLYFHSVRHESALIAKDVIQKILNVNP